MQPTNRPIQSRKFSLRLAKQVRTCPPPWIRKDPAHHDEYRGHIDQCPYCSGTEAVEAWDALANAMATATDGAREALHAVVQVGQLRAVRHDRGLWRNGLYYNPPVVLVIESTGVVSDNLLVAQTYNDIALAGPGDLIISADPCGLFVECWHTYTLKAADLGPTRGMLDADIVNAVMALGKDPAAYPSWAMLPRPMAAHDARIYFRELEVKVGYTFASY